MACWLLWRREKAKHCMAALFSKKAKFCVSPVNLMPWQISAPPWSLFGMAAGVCLDRKNPGFSLRPLEKKARANAPGGRKQACLRPLYGPARRCGTAKIWLPRRLRGCKMGGRRICFAMKQLTLTHSFRIEDHDA